MRFFIFDQQTHLRKYLPEMQASRLSYVKVDSFFKRSVKILVHSGVDDLEKYDFSFFFSYFIFPSSILNFFGEWQLTNRLMQVNDTIVQQGRVPPGNFSIKLLFGVRVLTAYHTKDKVSFSYGTLQGHPEIGINEFTFFIENNDLYAEVNTSADLGLFLSKLLAPIFTWPYISYCNNQALALMKKNFLAANQDKL